MSSVSGQHARWFEHRWWGLFIGIIIGKLWEASGGTASGRYLLVLEPCSSNSGLALERLFSRTKIHRKHRTNKNNLRHHINFETGGLRKEESFTD